MNTKAGQIVLVNRQRIRISKQEEILMLLNEIRVYWKKMNVYLSKQSYTA
jgi:hypothetical protein